MERLEVWESSDGCLDMMRYFDGAKCEPHAHHAHMQPARALWSGSPNAAPFRPPALPPPSCLVTSPPVPSPLAPPLPSPPGLNSARCFDPNEEDRLRCVISQLGSRQFEDRIRRMAELASPARCAIAKDAAPGASLQLRVS